MHTGDVRWVVVVTAALAAVGLLPAGGTAKSERSAVVRPGVAVGNVQLGMTLEQVRRALGGAPRSVIRRTNFGSEGRYVEHGWEFDGPRTIYTWTVGFRSTSRGGKLRVVRVGTTTPSQRTREGLGVGSRVREILTVYPDAVCNTRSQTEPFKGRWIVAHHRGRGMTAFQIDTIEPVFGKEPSFKVLEVLVQRNWISDEPGRGGCGSDDEWRRW